LKYWRGYLTAAIFAIFTYGLQEFAKTHTELVDMVYPYVTRLVQNTLAQWSASVDFLLWQVIAVVLILLVLASIVAMILLRWNLIQWLGWITAVVSMIFFLHTGVYGLNNYAGSVAEDIRLEEIDYTFAQLQQATQYYQDKANELSKQVPRSGGELKYPSFEELAVSAEAGFDALVYDEFYAVFAGSTLPVKELGWADMYSSMGITGFTMSLTGEAAVNPQIPPVSLPFTMCHEMAHRMCIASEKDANFTGFLACAFHPDVEFQYSAYFMAYRYCFNTLAAYGTTASDAAAKALAASESANLRQDMEAYDDFFTEKRSETATEVATTVNDTYIKANGDENGVISYGHVTDLLVSWHYQQFILPTLIEEENPFDPFDTTQVDVTGIQNPEG